MHSDHSWFLLRSYYSPWIGVGGGGGKWYVFGSEISIKQEVQTIFYLKVVIYIQ